MKTVNQIQFNGKKALLRVDFNVPLNEAFAVTDNTRIRAAVPTIKKILSDGGSVILMSHLGRPKEGPEDKFSLKHILTEVEKELGVKVEFASDCIGTEAIEKAAKLQSGQVLLLENVRFYKEETKGDADFAKKLAALGDVYVNDAFGTAHRAHASTAVIADSFTSENKCLGLLMAAEVENATKVLNESESPFTAIVGGAKVSDKIMILQNLLEKANNIIIGGGMAYTFIKALGGSIGNSLCEEERLGTAKLFLDQAKKKKVNIYLPIDSLAADKFSADATAEEVYSISIPDGKLGLDIGPQAREEFISVVKRSKTILWNGPMGVVEFDNFAKGTLEVGKAVAEATKEGAFSLVGGGDSVAAINKLGLASEVSFISTGGGATLEFLEGKELPGIHAVM